MKDAHTGMGLTNAHFDAIVENLAKTLKELGVSDELVQECGEVAETVRADTIGQ